MFAAGLSRHFLPRGTAHALRVPKAPGVRYYANLAEVSDYYARLGLQRGASKEEIKRAYKKLAMKLHPDRNHGKDSKEITDSFAAVNEAYEVLSDDEKRQLYDTYGKEAPTMGGDPFDIFNSVFGGGRGRQRGPMKTETIELVAKVPLEVFYAGGTQEVTYQREKKCGARADKCSACDGRGSVAKVVQSMGMIQQMMSPCGQCQGRGVQVTTRCDSCSCAGRTGTKSVMEKLSVAIEPGMQPGEVLMAAGMSDEMPGAVTGDVVVQLKAQPHPRLKWVGDDLLITQKVSLADALAGCTLNLPHPAGTVQVEMKPGELLSSKNILCLTGQGMPSQHGGHRGGGLDKTYGDMLVEVEIDFPELDEAKAKEIAGLLGKEGESALGETRGDVRKPRRVSRISMKQVQDREARRQQREGRRRQAEQQQQQVSCQHQ